MRRSLNPVRELVAWSSVFFRQGTVLFVCTAHCVDLGGEGRGGKERWCGVRVGGVRVVEVAAEGGGGGRREAGIRRVEEGGR